MGNLHSKFGHARPLGSRIIRSRRTDRQTDGRMDKSNAYCSFPYVRGIINHRTNQQSKVEATTDVLPFCSCVSIQSFRKSHLVPVMMVSWTPWWLLPLGRFPRFHSGSPGQRPWRWPNRRQVAQTGERLCRQTARLAVSPAATHSHSGCLAASQLHESRSVEFAGRPIRWVPAGSWTRRRRRRRRRRWWLDLRRRTTTTTTTTERRPDTFHSPADEETDDTFHRRWRHPHWHVLLIITNYGRTITWSTNTVSK